jgi:TRAP-type mannitol/chloroaromatic compound transport system substrate-binding protein
MGSDKIKLNRRGFMGAGLAAGATFGIVGKASAAAEVTWRVQAHWPKASGSFGDSLVVLKDELEKRTDGRFKLELFGAGEFAKGKEIYNFVQRGVVEMGTISPGYMLAESEMAGLAFGIPGTFRESWQAAHFLKNLGGVDLLNQVLNKKGVIYMSEKVYPTELVVKKPINSIEDFKALKLRSSGTMLEYLAAAGASPSYVAGPELYQALSSGVVDGAHWGAAIGAQSMSLWEVAKFHVRPALGYAADAFIFNKDAVEALPDDLRLHLIALTEERFWRRTAEYQHKEEIALSAGRNDLGVTVITFPDAVLEKFAAASTSILEGEAAKGELATKAADNLVGLLKDLGYQ